MSPSYFPKLLGSAQADKLAKILDVTLVGAAGAQVGQIGEPFDGGRYHRQALELGGVRRRSSATFSINSVIGHQALTHDVPRMNLHGALAYVAAFDTAEETLLCVVCDRSQPIAPLTIGHE